MIDTDDASSYEHSESINIRLLDAYLRYYMNLADPAQLDDEQWAEEVQNLHFIRTKEKEASKAT